MRLKRKRKGNTFPYGSTLSTNLTIPIILSLSDGFDSAIRMVSVVKVSGLIYL